jgi:hypothetical protein
MSASQPTGNLHPSNQTHSPSHHSQPQHPPPPRSQQPSRHVSPSQSATGSTPGSLPPTTGSTTSAGSPSVLPTYQYQQPLQNFDLPHPPPRSSSSSSFPTQPDRSVSTHPQQGGSTISGMSSMMLNPDSTAMGMTMSYEITPEVFEAFSYVEPITTNMTSGYDPGWGGMGTGPGV